MAGGRGPPTRCRGTTVLAHWHTLEAPWLPENYTVARTRSVPIGPQSPLHAAVRYFDTVDTRLISIRYGRRGTNCRTRPRRTAAEYLSPASHSSSRLVLLSFRPFLSVATLTRSATDFRVSWTRDDAPRTRASQDEIFEQTGREREYLGTKLA